MKQTREELDEQQEAMREEVTLQEAMETLDAYLNAGHKHQRAASHLKAKELYERYYNKEYVNRNER
jgi:hypothetical protein